MFSYQNLVSYCRIFSEECTAKRTRYVVHTCRKITASESSINILENMNFDKFWNFEISIYCIKCPQQLNGNSLNGSGILSDSQKDAGFRDYQRVALVCLARIRSIESFFCVLL